MNPIYLLRFWNQAIYWKWLALLVLIGLGLTAINLLMDIKTYWAIALTLGVTMILAALLWLVSKIGHHLMRPTTTYRHEFRYEYINSNMVAKFFRTKPKLKVEIEVYSEQRGKRIDCISRSIIISLTKDENQKYLQASDSFVKVLVEHYLNSELDLFDEKSRTSIARRPQNKVIAKNNRHDFPNLPLRKQESKMS